LAPEAAIEFCETTASELGLNLFDPQDETLYAPGREPQKATPRPQPTLICERCGKLIESGTPHAESPRLLQLTVDLLTTEETRDFMERSLGPSRELSQFADTLSTITKGNPRFLMEILAQLCDNGVVSGGPFRWRVRHDALHEYLRHSSLRSLVSTRLQSVTAMATQVLEWLSILSEPATISLVHQASGLPLLELQRSLRELVVLGVLRSDSSELESRFSFSHDVYRDAIYGRLPADRKASLHRSIGVALERLWGEPNDARCLPLAFHFVRGHCTTKGPKYALAAATWAHRQGAAHQAISSYLDSLNLIPDDETDRRCQILERTAVLLRQIGDLRGGLLEPVAADLVHARHLRQHRHVLGIVDAVEIGLVLGRDVHLHDIDVGHRDPPSAHC